VQQKQNAGRLVAVVVTHNRLTHLKTTLERLLESSEQDLPKIVIFDNASTDGSSQWLAEQRDPRVCTVTSPENIGGAGGFEAGMRYAVAQFDPDWLLLMDDDGRPYADAIASFHDGNRASCEAVAAAVYTPQGLICDINRPSRNPFWNPSAFFKTLLGRGREGFHLEPKDYRGNTLLEVDGASFVGLFVSRKAVELAGYPRGDLFLYAEDVLFTLSIRQAGGRIVIDPSVRFEHDHQTRRVGEKRFTPIWKSYYFHRNLLIAYRMAAGAWFWPSLLIILPRWTLKLLDHPGQRGVFLRLLFLAIRDGLAEDLDRPHKEVLSRSGETPTA
jgi:GT2 family glycosyltransferase